MPDQTKPLINALEKYQQETPAAARASTQTDLELVTDDMLEAERQQSLRAVRRELERLRLRHEALLHLWRLAFGCV